MTVHLFLITEGAVRDVQQKAIMYLSGSLKYNVNGIHFLVKLQHSVIQGQSPPCLKEKNPPPLTFPTPGSPGS